MTSRRPLPVAHAFPFTLALALALAVASVRGQIPPPDDAPRPQSPEASAAAFQLPDGFRMELVAHEPLIASPSGLAWDEHGRFFVSELHGYNLEGQLDVDALNQTGKLDTEVRRVQADEKFKKAAEPGTYGVIKVLHDTNADGRMDRADVWSTNLPPAYGLVPARGGVIVACAPHILYFADRDNDGRAEVREILFTGFRVGPLERGINAPQWGPDGWIYFGRGAGGGRITGPHLKTPVELPGADFRIRADGTAIEPVTGSTGTFGFALTEAGDRFTMSTIEPGRYVAPLPWRYLIRNPDAATSSLDVSSGDRRVYPLAPAHPWRLKRAGHEGYFKFYRDRYGASDSDAAGWFTSACSPLVYHDTVLPGLHGHYLVCEPSGNIIHLARIEADGPILRLRRPPGYESSEFAASRDSWSHPMNLLHGPDGAVWVVDYYREIIEDYSAIPRHLQQQYGVYAGHDRGRIYRLTHRKAANAPTPNLASLDPAALAKELASPILWRRQTAQRLLIEQPDGPNAAPHIRALLTQSDTSAGVRIAALRSLEGLNRLQASDLGPFLRDPAESVRVHALQLADARLGQAGGAELLRGIAAAAGSESSPRVLLQIALSLGESSDPIAFRALVRLAREKADVRWMDAAILSSVHGRALDLFNELIQPPGVSNGFLGSLAQSIAAGRDVSHLSHALRRIASSDAPAQAAVLNGLAKGRKNAPRKPLADVAARTTLASLSASPHPEVRTAARALDETFSPVLAEEEPSIPAGILPPTESISAAAFQSFTDALAKPRDPRRGHAVFLQACTPCHRVGDAGHAVGPDLLGQVGISEEALLKELLLPNDRIRPGFETTLIELTSGPAVTGILKDDGATSVTLVSPQGVESTLLRKDIRGIRRLASSLMPSYAESLSPTDVADLLAWLKDQLRTGASTASEPPPTR